MKKFTKIIICVLLCLSVFFAGCGGGTTESSEDNLKPVVPDNITYESYGSFWMKQHSDTVMPVTAYNSNPPSLVDGGFDYLTSKDTFKYYSEAGVNVMMGLKENTASQEVEQALDWCSEYGLAYLVNFPGAGNTNTSTVKSMLMRVKYHDAFAGIMQMDEPGRVDFDSIANSADTINDVLPEDIIDQVLLHVNIFPNYATDYQLYNRVNSGELPEGGYSYNQYVEDYMNIIKPKVLSYDNYPLTGHEDGLNGTSYFSNMSVIREAAMEANIPFWVFVETCSFNAGNRVPDQAEILWQVNTALSFGVKGLQYFTGVIPVSSAEEFSGAMFDLYGNKTAVYDYVKTANEQVQAVDHVLMHSISKGMMQVGSLPYSGESGFRDGDIIPSYKKLTSAQGAHSLIGCFDYDGLTAYYITNNSITEDESLTLNFSESVKGYYIAKGEQTSFNAATLTLQMQPGEGILVVVK